jgi:hypothetical protein
MEDPFLPQLYSWFSSLGTTFEQKQQKFAASSPKTTWDKALSMKLLSKSYPTKEKTLFAEMLTKSGSLKIHFYLLG